MNNGLLRGIGRLSNLGPDSTNTSIGTGVGPSGGSGMSGIQQNTTNITVNSFATDGVFIGYQAGARAQDQGVIAIGSQAAPYFTSAAWSGSPNPGLTVVGYQAGLYLTQHVGNTVIGYQAGKYLGNAFVGNGVSPNNGINNIALGHQALCGVTSFSSNFSVSNNVAIGYQTLCSAIANGNNTNANVCIGASTASTNFTGTDCVYIGYSVAVPGGGTHTASSNVGVGSQALGVVSSGSDNVAIGYQSHYGPNGSTANALTSGARNTAIGRETGYGSATQRNDTVTVGYRAIVNGNNAVAIGSGASAGAAGAVAIGKDSSGTSAATTTTDGFRLGTTAHTIEVPGLIQWLTAGNEQTTVGAAGGASALPGTPTKYLKIKDSAGTTLVVPAYAAA